MSGPTLLTSSASESANAAFTQSSKRQAVAPGIIRMDTVPLRYERHHNLNLIANAEQKISDHRSFAISIAAVNGRNSLNSYKANTAELATMSLRLRMLVVSWRRSAEDKVYHASTTSVPDRASESYFRSHPLTTSQSHQTKTIPAVEGHKVLYAHVTGYDLIQGSGWNMRRRTCIRRILTPATTV